MSKKVVRRTIAESKICRVKYDKLEGFDLLEVRITHKDRIYVYEIESKFLSTKKDSIYFYPKNKSGNLVIQWDQEAEKYIRLVSEERIIH